MNDAVLAAKTDTDIKAAPKGGAHATAAALTPGKGLLVLLGIVVLVGAFIALNHALGIADFWVAFLFLLYWSSIEHMSFAKLPGCITGALVGLLMGYLLQTLPVVMGAAGGVIFLIAILVLIYCQVMGWFPVAVNMMTMLFLTVVTIPTVQATADFLVLLAALGLGLAYFVGLLAVSNFLKQRMAKR